MPAACEPVGGIVSVEDDREVDASSAELLASLARQVEQLEVAVNHRTTIGQAQGILMAHLDIDAVTAFAYLKRMSMESNRKLIEIAEEVARTRQPPNVQQRCGWGGRQSAREHRWPVWRPGYDSQIPRA